MSYITGTTQRSELCKFTDDMGGKYTDYSQVQGYTRASHSTHIVTMMKPDSTDGVLVEISYATVSTVTGKKAGLMHGNDCTYSPDDKSYYIATGGYPKKLNAPKSNKIVRYGTDLKKIADYYYDEPGKDKGETDVSSIEHMFGIYFLIGKVNHVDVCQINHSSHTFKKISGFDLPVFTGISTYNPQGMCYDNSRLYKAYSSNDSSEMNKNYIAKYTLGGNTGGSPLFTDANLFGIYACDVTSAQKFEIESISCVGSELTFAADVVTANVTHKGSV